MIINGDCLTVMQAMQAGSFDLIVTSPPYNIKNSSGNGLKSNTQSGKWVNPELSSGYEDHADDMEHDEYVKWQRACLGQMMRLIKPNGAIFYNHKWRVQNGLLQTREDIMQGFPVRQIIIWQRPGGINFNDSYFLPTYEVIYLIAKPDFKLKAKANAVGDVWKIRLDRKTDHDHPAPFPLVLAKRCIESTNAEIVLDPFGGSGTTALGANQLGVNAVMIDNSFKYCLMAKQRLSVIQKMLF